MTGLEHFIFPYQKLIRQLLIAELHIRPVPFQITVRDFH